MLWSIPISQICVIIFISKYDLLPDTVKTYYLSSLRRSSKGSYPLSLKTYFCTSPLIVAVISPITWPGFFLKVMGSSPKNSDPKDDPIKSSSLRQIVLIKFKILNLICSSRLKSPALSIFFTSISEYFNWPSPFNVSYKNCC